jgi:hypothetical protein
MDGYHVALFLHIVTLVVASGVTAVTKLAVGRRIRAKTVGEVLEWHNVLTGAAKLFPLCLAAFVITGAYMLTSMQGRVWSSGFVTAGFVGVGLLLASGIFLALKGKALKQVLEGIAANGMEVPAPRLAPSPLVAILPAVNTSIAMAVVFDMAIKPASVSVALGVIAAAIGLTAAMAARRLPPRSDLVPDLEIPAHRVGNVKAL